MNVRIHDLMAKNVIVAQPHHTIDHVKALMDKHGINAIPVASGDGEPVGIITTSDLAGDVKGGSPVSQHMTSPVLKVPAYNDVSAAARIMRKNKCHHVVVTHEGQIEGIISSFDLLQLIEGHRFVAKSAPQKGSKGKKHPDAAQG
jgi:CBS domain-containing protein